MQFIRNAVHAGCGAEPIEGGGIAFHWLSIAVGSSQLRFWFSFNFIAFILQNYGVK